MIGLMYLGALLIWIFISILLGSAIPRWLGIKRHQVGAGFLFALIVFVAPVADEIIAYPQMASLCKQTRLFEFAPGMDAKSATGRTVYAEERSEPVPLLPSSVLVKHLNTVYVDATTKEDVLTSQRFYPLQGMLGMPAGSSGKKMTVLLSPCTATDQSFDSKGIPTRFSHLNLTKVPKP